MHDAQLTRALELICERDNRYPPAAYTFLREALDITVNKTGREGNPPGARHVSGQELCEGIRHYGLSEFGPLAGTVLAYWGITTTEDFGNLVFNLVEAGLLGKSESDSPEDFRRVFDFDQAFRAPFRAKRPWTPSQEQ